MGPTLIAGSLGSLLEGEGGEGPWVNDDYDDDGGGGGFWRRRTPGRASAVIGLREAEDVVARGSDPT